jgi:hypothetical protein
MRKSLFTGLVLLIFAAIFSSIHNEINDPNSKLRSDDVKVSEEPVIIGFPLKGEWIAPNTPGKKVPSHGTDQFGERYAFDFVQVDWERNGTPFYKPNFFQYVFFGVPLNDCYGWGKGIYAPCGGEIIIAKDGHPERERVHLASDLAVALKNAYTLNVEKDGIQSFAGNYIVMQCSPNVYAGFAHLQKGSISVSVGQRVKLGDMLGKVGHSGNSTAPHLHFQLMDRSDILSAKGIPIVFERYEIFEGGEWITVKNGIPSDKDRIRFYP